MGSAPATHPGTSWWRHCRNACRQPEGIPETLSLSGFPVQSHEGSPLRKLTDIEDYCMNKLNSLSPNLHNLKSAIFVKAKDRCRDSSSEFPSLHCGGSGGESRDHPDENQPGQRDESSASQMTILHGAGLYKFGANVGWRRRS